MSAISRKNQVTIPKSVLEATGLSAGDDVRITSAGPGRIEVVKSEELVSAFAGSFDDSVYPPEYLDEVRKGWT
jgi:AbrB family looped-hinge helix DNA binding protein